VGSVYRVNRLRTGSRNVADVSLMMKGLKYRCGSTLDNSQKTFICGFRHTGKDMRQVYQCWWRICRDTNVPPPPRLEYHMFYVSYLFVTYLLIPPSTYNLF
jgi:hypothetical protein